MASWDVKQGDSFASIAGDYYGDQRMLGALMRANPGTFHLRPGMTLRLPPKQDDPYVSEKELHRQPYPGAEGYDRSGNKAGAAGEGVGSVEELLKLLDMSPTVEDEPYPSQVAPPTQIIDPTTGEPMDVPQHGMPRVEQTQFLTDLTPEMQKTALEKFLSSVRSGEIYDSPEYDRPGGRDDAQQLVNMVADMDSVIELQEKYQQSQIDKISAMKFRGGPESYTPDTYMDDVVDYYTKELPPGSLITLAMKGIRGVFDPRDKRDPMLVAEEEVEEPLTYFTGPHDDIRPYDPASKPNSAIRSPAGLALTGEGAKGLHGVNAQQNIALDRAVTAVWSTLKFPVVSAQYIWNFAFGNNDELVVDANRKLIKDEELAFNMLQAGTARRIPRRTFATARYGGLLGGLTEAWRALFDIEGMYETVQDREGPPPAPAFLMLGPVVGGAGGAGGAMTLEQIDELADWQEEYIDYTVAKDEELNAMRDEAYDLLSKVDSLAYEYTNTGEEKYLELIESNGARAEELIKNYHVEQMKMSTTGFNPYFAVTWNSDRIARGQFIDALVEVEMQLGRPLEVKDIVGIKDHFIDPWEEMAFEIGIDPLTWIGIDFIAPIWKGMKSVVGMAARSIADDIVAIALRAGAKIPEGSVMRKFHAPLFVSASMVDAARTGAVRSAANKMRNPFYDALVRLGKDSVNTLGGGESFRGSVDKLTAHLQEAMNAGTKNVDEARALFKGISDMPRNFRIRQWDSVLAAANKMSSIGSKKFTVDKWAGLIQEIAQRFYDDAVEATQMKLARRVASGEITKEYALAQAEKAGIRAMNDYRRISAELANGVRKAVMRGSTHKASGLLTDSIAYRLLKEIPWTKGYLIDSPAMQSFVRAYTNFTRPVIGFWIQAALSFNPRWVWRNMIDSTFRFLIYGGSMNDDLGVIFKTIFTDMPEDILTAETMTTFLRDGIDVGQSPAVRMVKASLKGDPMSLDPIRGPMGFMRWEWQRLTVKGAEEGWRPLRSIVQRTYQSWTHGWSDFNSAIEFTLRIRLLHKEFFSAYNPIAAKTLDAALAQLTKAGASEDTIRLARSAWDQSGLNAERMATLIERMAAEGIAGRSLHSFLLPEEVTDLLRALPSHERDAFLRPIVDKLDEVIQIGAKRGDDLSPIISDMFDDWIAAVRDPEWLEQYKRVGHLRDAKPDIVGAAARQGELEIGESLTEETAEEVAERVAKKKAATEVIEEAAAVPTASLPEPVQRTLVEAEVQLDDLKIGEDQYFAFGPEYREAGEAQQVTFAQLGDTGRELATEARTIGREAVKTAETAIDVAVESAEAARKLDLAGQVLQYIDTAQRMRDKMKRAMIEIFPGPLQKSFSYRGAYWDAVEEWGRRMYDGLTSMAAEAGAKASAGQDLVMPTFDELIERMGVTIAYNDDGTIRRIRMRNIASKQGFYTESKAGIAAWTKAIFGDVPTKDIKSLSQMPWERYYGQVSSEVAAKNLAEESLVKQTLDFEAKKAATERAALFGVDEEVTKLQGKLDEWRVKLAKAAPASKAKHTAEDNIRVLEDKIATLIEEGEEVVRTKVGRGGIYTFSDGYTVSKDGKKWIVTFTDGGNRVPNSGSFSTLKGAEAWLDQTRRAVPEVIEKVTPVLDEVEELIPGARERLEGWVKQGEQGFKRSANNLRIELREAGKNVSETIDNLWKELSPEIDETLDEFVARTQVEAVALSEEEIVRRQNVLSKGIGDATNVDEIADTTMWQTMMDELHQMREELDGIVPRRAAPGGKKLIQESRSPSWWDGTAGKWKKKKGDPDVLNAVSGYAEGGRQDVVGRALHYLMFPDEIPEKLPKAIQNMMERVWASAQENLYRGVFESTSGDLWRPASDYLHRLAGETQVADDLAQVWTEQTGKSQAKRVAQKVAQQVDEGKAEFWRAWLMSEGIDSYPEHIIGTPEKYLAYLRKQLDIIPEGHAARDMVEYRIWQVENPGTWGHTGQLYEGAHKPQMLGGTQKALPVPYPSSRMHEGWRTALASIEHQSQRVEAAVEALEIWKRTMVDMVDSDSMFTMVPPDDQMKMLQEAFLPTAVAGRNAAVDAALHGSDAAEGAIDRVNRIMVDYSDYSALDQTIQNVYPFWKFTSRSIPFWIDTIAEHPEILAFWQKELLLSRRVSFQHGAITSRGEQKPGMVGYLPVPGTGVWIDPLAALSVRYLLPMHDRYWHEDMEDVSIGEQVVDWLHRQGEYFGVSMAPWVEYPLIWSGVLDYNRVSPYGIVPLMDLFPKWGQRWVQEKLRIYNNPYLKWMWTPDRPWEDYLIEVRLLRSLMGKLDADPDNALAIANEHKFALGYGGVNEDGSPIRVEREDSPLWQDARHDLEKSDYSYRMFGWGTGFYPKEFSDEDAELLRIRTESNFLRDMVNNNVGAMVFGLDLDIENRYENYIMNRYETPEGILNNMYGAMRWTRSDETGEQLYGMDRRDLMAMRLNEDEVTGKYYEAMGMLGEWLDSMLLDLPIGADGEMFGEVWEAYFKQRSAIVSNPMYNDARRRSFMGYKPTDMIEEHVRDMLYWAVKETRPKYNREEMTYSEYELKLLEWEENFPILLSVLSEPFKLEVYDYATGGRGITPEIMQQILDGEFTAGGDRMIEVGDMVARVMTGANYEDYAGWLKDQDTILDALNEAWRTTYWNTYWEAVDNLSGDDRVLAERAWKEKHPEPPTLNEMAEWVLENYPNRDWTLEQIIVGGKDDALSVDDRLTSDDPIGRREDLVWDVLMRAGRDKDALLDVAQAMAPAGMDVGEHLSVWYVVGGKGAAWKDSDEFKQFADLLMDAAIKMELDEPTNAELREWSAAKKLNDDFWTSVDEAFGEDFPRLLSLYWRMDSSQRREVRLADERIGDYFDYRDIFGENFQLWAKHYNEDVYEPGGETLTSTGAASSAVSTNVPLPAGFAKVAGGVVVDEIVALVEHDQNLSAYAVPFLTGMAERHPEFAQFIEALLEADKLVN